MQNDSTAARISAIVLAAGLASRFGSNKLLADFRGKPLLQHSLAAAASVCPGRVSLVVGHDADRIVASAAGVNNETIVNSKFERGMGSSIAAGVRSCAAHTDAIILMLADQPLVTADHLRDLIKAWSGADTEIVASLFDDVRAPPILFPRRVFAALSKLSGDTGARDIVSSDEFSVTTVACPAARFDIDKPDDLAQADLE